MEEYRSDIVCLVCNIKIRFQKNNNLIEGPLILKLVILQLSYRQKIKEVIIIDYKVNWG